MRLLLFELRPAVLDSEGLIGALQHRIKSVEEGLGVKVSLQANGLPELPRDVEDALYHIALEALNNIVKHAESKAATIQFTGTDESITMEISDEGKGFDIDLLQRGLGLRNMRERGQMLDSEVIVQSNPGEGTRVTVDVKLPSHSSVSSR
jgi:signal transduction histidine kinase